jgi:hypothetical protein
MSGFNQVLIGGYPSGGLITDRKPMMIPKEAFSKLENAYVWRDRTKKRDGSVPMGRLSRVFNSVSLGLSGVSPWTFNIFSLVSPPITEPFKQLQPGSITITIGAVILRDTSDNGILTSITPGNSGTINYITGQVVIITTQPAGTATTINFTYFPSLPVQGILKRDVATVGIDQTVFFDEVYAYQYAGTNFQELSPGTIWTGTNTDFFWGANYQGANPSLRYFFVTNFNLNPAMTLFDPIYYYNNSTWTALTPLITATTSLYQALILVPYYGRMLALNTWEGTTAGTFVAASNFVSRCRFSQIGDPTIIGSTGPYVPGSWASDVAGFGGFIDAPTNEAIVSAAFYRNTLIVFFEYSTWQVRYIGEYGLPFIFERVSSDFGSVSTYSPIVFDQGVLSISDRGVIEAGSNGVKRLDEAIPDTIFSFSIAFKDPKFVHGVRDFEKELVYWNYLDLTDKGIFQANPNTVLLYNYRNNTWAKFRDTITCFGIGQFAFGVNWDDQTVLWDSETSWDNTDDQDFLQYVLAGNQHGFISVYEQTSVFTPIESDTSYAPSLFIYSVNLTLTPIRLGVPNHNLQNNELIYISGMLWNGTDPNLNGKIYLVIAINDSTISLMQWNGTSYVDVISSSTATYIGNGVITLLPKMNIVGKDFNPYQEKGKGFKVSYIDFLMDTNNEFPSVPAVSIQLFVNSYLGIQANLQLGNQEVSNSSIRSGFIQFATQSNPCQIKSIGHSLQTGDIITIANVVGMTQLNVITPPYTITVINANIFSLNGIDSSLFTMYQYGGVWSNEPKPGSTYIEGSDYAWYRFYSNQYGQFLRVALTYDDAIMNEISTHQTPLVLHAMNLYFLEGGRIVN